MMNGDPKLLFHIFKINVLRLIIENIVNFYQSVFPEKKFSENICRKGGFWGNYPLIFTLSGQSYD